MDKSGRSRGLAIVRHAVGHRCVCHDDTRHQPRLSGSSSRRHPGLGGEPRLRLRRPGCWRSTATRTGSTGWASPGARRWSPSSTARDAGATRRSRRSTSSRSSSPSGTSRWSRPRFTGGRPCICGPSSGSRSIPCHGGRTPDLDDMVLLRQLGRLVARIHLHGEVRDFVHRPRLDPASYGEASRDYLLEAGFNPGRSRAGLHQRVRASAREHSRMLCAGWEPPSRPACTRTSIRAMCWSTRVGCTSWTSTTPAWGRRCRICGCSCRGTGMSRRRSSRSSPAGTPSSDPSMRESCI